MGLPKKEIYNGKVPGTERLVGDIMKPLTNLATVSAETTIKNAAYILKNAIISQSAGESLNYLLVFENKKLVGMLGIMDLLSATNPPDLKDQWFRGWNVSGWTQPVAMKGMFGIRCRSLADRPVREILSPMTIMVKAGDTLDTAVGLMAEHHKETIPVVSGGSVVGIVRDVDIFTEMAAVIA